MKISGAEAVAFVLKKLGVSNIWGIPGAKTIYMKLRSLFIY
jgi:thiamine pyrophosphate-dependent acetolactate synthase large subunit-like protein